MPVLDGGAAINEDLIAFWRLSDASGAVFDLTRRRPPGTVPGNPDRVIGQRHKAISFPTSGQRVVAQTSKIVSGLANWSISSSAKAASSSRVGGRSVYSERGSTGNDIVKIGCSDSGISGGNKVSVVIRNTAGTLLYAPTSTSVYNDGQYHTVTATKQGTAISLYFDGRLEGTATWSGADTFTEASVQSWIGDDQGDVAPFLGPIEWVRLHSRALLPSEAALLHQNHDAGIWVRRLWAFNASGGTTYSDTISDAITVADSIAVARTASLATSDAVTAADSMPGLLTGAGATSDAVTATDSLTVDRTADVTISDDVVAGDSATGGYTYSDTISDDVTLGDSVEGEIAALTARGYARGRSRSWEDVWEDVPSELQPVVSLAEHYVDLPRVEDVVTEQLARYARLGARASLNRRMTLLEEVKRTIVAVVAQAAEDDDEDALIQLL